MRRKILSLVILIIGGVWIWASRVSDPQALTGTLEAPKEGFTAPDFQLNTLDGDTIRLSELRGRVILVNFWASWCAPCKAEMPAIQRVSEMYGPEEMLVLAVNASFQDRLADVSELVDQNGIGFPVLLDQDGEVSDLYQITSFPTTYFIDRDGVVSEIVIGGPMSEALLRTKIETLLDKKSDVPGN